VGSHEHYMQQAIELAKRAEGCTSPNPLVGCVVVKNDVVVGSGWHRAAGQAHAETVALAQAAQESHGATLYVCLEPCSHFGRTPPCVNAIIEAGVKRVVYAIADPNPSATGGAKLLEQAGIETLHGVLQDEARLLNRFYLHHHDTQKPYIVAKFATSLDGRIATRSGHSQWISGEQSRRRAHALRQAVDAIVVGVQSVIDDDPRLTVREPSPHVNQVCDPLRIVLDSQGRIPMDCQLLSSELATGTLVVTTQAVPSDVAQNIRKQGAELLIVQENDEQRVDITELIAALGQRGLQSLMVEGGASVLGAFFDAHLVNEIWSFIAPLVIGGQSAPAAIGGQGIDQLSAAARIQSPELEKLGDDWLIRGKTKFA